MVKAVYVPAEGHEKRFPARALIVGYVVSAEEARVWVPPTRFGNLADTCRASEHATPAPRRTAPRSSIVEVGKWHPYEGEIRLTPQGGRLLGRWLGRPVHRNDLEARDSRQNRRRDARRHLMRGDAARAFRIDPGRGGL